MTHIGTLVVEIKADVTHALRLLRVAYIETLIQIANIKAPLTAQGVRLMLYMGENVTDNLTRRNMWFLRYRKAMGIEPTRIPHVYRRCLNCGRALIVPMISPDRYCDLQCGEAAIREGYENA